MKTFFLAAATLVALSAPALAANPNFCADYARTAVHEVDVNMSIPGCFKGFDARWNRDYGHHYGWCLGVSSKPPTPSANTVAPTRRGRARADVSAGRLRACAIGEAERRRKAKAAASGYFRRRAARAPWLTGPKAVRRRPGRNSAAARR